MGNRDLGGRQFKLSAKNRVIDKFKVFVVIWTLSYVILEIILIGIFDFHYGGTLLIAISGIIVIWVVRAVYFWHDRRVNS